MVNTLHGKIVNNIFLLLRNSVHKNEDKHTCASCRCMSWLFYLIWGSYTAAQHSSLIRERPPSDRYQYTYRQPSNYTTVDVDRLTAGKIFIIDFQINVECTVPCCMFWPFWNTHTSLPAVLRTFLPTVLKTLMFQVNTVQTGPPAVVFNCIAEHDGRLSIWR